MRYSDRYLPKVEVAANYKRQVTQSLNATTCHIAGNLSHNLFVTQHIVDAIALSLNATPPLFIVSGNTLNAIAQFVIVISKTQTFMPHIKLADQQTS